MTDKPSNAEETEIAQDSVFNSAENAEKAEHQVESTPESELKRQLEEAEKRALMCQADLENFRRRKNRESADQLKYANLPLLQNLLGIVDNLERALESARNEPAEASALQQGVEMVFSQLQLALENAGCVRMESVGQVFDPNIHEAIMMQPGEAPANTIVVEALAGYRLHDRVVRPAKVIISTGSAELPGTS